MIIPVEFYNYLREQIRTSDIVKQKVSLTKKGNEYLGICPFHSEKTPSFTVNDAKRFYHCFGCGVHGDIIKFVAETTGLSYKEAAIKIAQENSIELPKMSADQQKEYDEADQIYNVLELASAYFTDQINKEVEGYLLARGITKNIKEQFSIGYAPGKGLLIKYFEKKSIPLKILLSSGLVGKKEDGKIYEVFNNRIIFPIRNTYNRIVGFGGRVIGDGMPKYINSPETLVFKKSETMYGENTAISASYKKNYSIVVEGYMDVIALHQAGINEAVASLGTSVTEKHLQKLWRSGEEIIICLDGDNAGQRASRRLIDIALPMIAYDKKISFVILPNSKDPDEVIKSEGIELFNKLLAERINLSEAIWLSEYGGKTFSSAESKAVLESTLDTLCLQIKDKVLSANFRRYFKEQMWQKLYNKKGARNGLKKNNKTYIGSNGDKEYTEMEVLELSLCSFIIKFPGLLKIARIREFVSDLTLSSPDFNEFKEWYISQIDMYDDINENKTKELAEKTGFYDSFLVLSDPKKIFLDTIFIEKNKANCELIFDLLSKKYYLLSLKQEYINIINSNKEEVRLKAPSYLKEIQENSKQLSKLSEFFIN
ncbi:MAG TPA: DNA primase [Candidatus Megaira endosymbiont of Stentor roeselii]|nr:DNA primase [Candidatus Megaera endosymbiont of Stentor roeselii]